MIIGEIPNTEQREWLSNRIHDAHDEWTDSYGLSVEAAEQADRIANSIADLSEIELIEPANHGNDNYK